jgi:hypothetical protein
MENLRTHLTGLKDFRPNCLSRWFIPQEVHVMKFGAFTSRCGSLVFAACALPSLWPSHALAQSDHQHALMAPQKLTLTQQLQAQSLVDAVHDATSRFQDVGVATAEGYALQFGCVSGSDVGAMGMHFINGSLLDDVIDVEQPEIVLYEPLPGGGVQLTGADYIVFAKDWSKKHKDPPQLMGQLFHFFDSPNRFGLPPFYTLHVWAWKENPNGAFTNWNPTVSCEAFVPQN